MATHCKTSERSERVNKMKNPTKKLECRFACYARVNLASIASSSRYLKISPKNQLEASLATLATLAKRVIMSSVASSYQYYAITFSNEINSVCLPVLHERIF